MTDDELAKLINECEFNNPAVTGEELMEIAEKRVAEREEREKKMTNGIKEGINLADKKSEKTLDRVVDGLKSCIDILEKVELKHKLEKLEWDGLMSVARGLAQDDHDNKLTKDGQEILAYCAILMSERLKEQNNELD